jgi:uncharacterized protein (DUF2147 family)
MKNVMFILSIILGVISTGFAQTAVGTWKNIDDTDGKEKSLIQIYESNGKLRGKVIKLLPAATITKCDACKGANKGKSIQGMDILWGLESVGKGEYDNGEILDPKTGKIYDCSITVQGNKLLVRGYLGLSIFGRTQTWYKAS